MPSHHLPLLLTAYQYRFGCDLDALGRHLIDTPCCVAWDELGTDLLDGAPNALPAALAGGERWPSTTLDNVITPDGSPPTRMTVTDETATGQDMQWGYVLHPSGIEVISVTEDEHGPPVRWDPDTVQRPPPTVASPPSSSEPATTGGADSRHADGRSRSGRALHPPLNDAPPPPRPPAPSRWRCGRRKASA
ncbi:hypothetical protein [Streptomyces sp. AK02-01A]|uniref:hypothetical protein n=1 Tax=Streptomyces sp. AK02-01A TaxID=3028648 RepID=UPI0029A5A568|nr:hypothetical protein [Streptomyces sp. AK02-01A]MDX3855667.1 hypothetical protein [Streptomyces sp. AK02-01A]